MELSEVAARTAGENFPVGSVLFPRPLRPHNRALYCYARFVDEVGDSFEGDRLAALDELEGEVDAAFEGRATWPVLQNVEPTILEFDLPREPFLRLIEANRMDQRVTEYVTWDELKNYCVHSADPCGRLVLGVLQRLGEPEMEVLVSRLDHAMKDATRSSQGEADRRGARAIHSRSADPFAHEAPPVRHDAPPVQPGVGVG